MRVLCETSEREREREGCCALDSSGAAAARMSSLDCLELCRLCLVKERVSVPIFEDEGDVRQIFLKITACLPVKVRDRPTDRE